MNRLIYILVAAIMLTLPGFTAPKTANANPNITVLDSPAESGCHPGFSGRSG